MTNFLYRFLRVFVWIYYSFKYNITVHNKEKLPKRKSVNGKGGYIVASNHQNYNDPPVIAAMVRGRFSFMAKKELFEGKKFFALLIRACGAFPVDRGGKDSGAIDRAAEDLAKKKVFVIFPEGKRSKDGVIGRAKSGVAVIAAKANVPVLPVCIMYGLGGNKRNIDFAVGDFINPEEFNITVDENGLPNRKDIRHTSEKIIDGIKELQKQICLYRGIEAPKKD